MKSGLFFLLIFLLSFSVAAQRGNPPARVNKQWLLEQDSAKVEEILQTSRLSSSLDRGASVHFMPFSLLNLFSRLRVGGQYKPNRFSYLLDVEYGTDFNGRLPNDLADRNYRFFGIRPEIRYDLDAYRPGLYAGLEFPVNFVRRNVEGDFLDAEGERIFFDLARQERTRIAAIGKLGYQTLATQHLLVDVYAGLGVAYRYLAYLGRVNERINPEEFLEEWGFFGLGQEGVRWLPELALGIRVGWWF